MSSGSPHGPGTLSLILYRLEQIETNTTGLVSNVRFDLELAAIDRRIGSLELDVKERKAQAGRIRVGLVLALAGAAGALLPGTSEIIGAMFS